MNRIKTLESRLDKLANIDELIQERRSTLDKKENKCEKLMKHYSNEYAEIILSDTDLAWEICYLHSERYFKALSSKYCFEWIINNEKFNLSIQKDYLFLALNGKGNVSEIFKSHPYILNEIDNREISCIEIELSEAKQRYESLKLQYDVMRGV